MTIYTNKGNYGSIKDLLKDMEIEGFDDIEIKDILCICNQIHLGNVLGVHTKKDVKKMVEQLEKGVVF